MTVSDDERDATMKCCKKQKLCVPSHVISQTSDKTEFYEAFYKVLNKNLQTFSSDLETRTSTRQMHAIKSKLNSLIEKLKSRNAPITSPLTTRCLEILKSYVLYYICAILKRNKIKYLLFLTVFLRISSQIKSKRCCWIQAVWK